MFWSQGERLWSIQGCQRGQTKEDKVGAFEWLCRLCWSLSHILVSLGMWPILKQWQHEFHYCRLDKRRLDKGSFNWVLVPGYSSYSPELVMSIYDTPVSISAGQNLRLWYIEDLDDTWEGDNHGRACADIYGEFV